MKLDLSEIVTHVGMRIAYEIDEPAYVDEDLECTTSIRGQIVFTNTGSVLLVEGRAATKVALACSRCLTYYEEPIHFAIEEQFPLEVKAVGPHGRPGQVIVEEDENPDAGKLFEGYLFDLTELLRQCITLSLPIQPLHDEACRGLCPICGQDLNERACGCERREIHPAMAKLAILLSQKQI
jgi:uncharacterized protein